MISGRPTLLEQPAELVVWLTCFTCLRQGNLELADEIAEDVLEQSLLPCPIQLAVDGAIDVAEEVRDRL
jgi:hypothetical protein